MVNNAVETFYIFGHFPTRGGLPAESCLASTCLWKKRGIPVKEGYRLMLVDKDGVLVSEFQLTENALTQPEAFVAALKESIEYVEEEEP